MAQTAWQIWRKNIFIFLPSIKNYLNDKYPWSSLQNWKNKYFFILPSKKTSLNILDLLCRIEEMSIFITYSTKQKKLLEYTESSLWNWKNKYFYYSTKHKKDSFNRVPFNILGLLCRIEKKWLYYSTKQKHPP